MAESPFILVLNATEGLLHIVIARQEGDGGYTRLCAQGWHAPSQGAELLAPALADALQRLRIAPQDIGKIAAVRGPGSFTGLRLVLATASGLARATGALQAGLDYLPLLAANALHAIPTMCASPRRAWVLTHARRDLVHMQGFEEQPHAPLALRRICEVLLCSPNEAALYLNRFEAEVPGHTKGAAASLVLGSGLTRNREFFAHALESPLLLPPSFDHPTVDALLRAATDAIYDAADPEPLYIRPADAIDNLERIAASLGLDPEAAKLRLHELTTN